MEGLTTQISVVLLDDESVLATILCDDDWAHPNCHLKPLISQIERQMSVREDVFAVMWRYYVEVLTCVMDCCLNDEEVVSTQTLPGDRRYDTQRQFKPLMI